jgi:uncharacterized protein YjbI with pentapeptide repeats
MEISIGLNVDSDNVNTVVWNEEGLFKFCEFGPFSTAESTVDKDFIHCTFRNVDWYMGLFSLMNFIECNFYDCTFRGCSFPCTFVECELWNCRFVGEHANASCDFEDTKAYNCKIRNCPDFDVQNRCEDPTVSKREKKKKRR